MNTLEEFISAMKAGILKFIPDAKSSHIYEALAFSAGFKTYAAMRAKCDGTAAVNFRHPYILFRLAELGSMPGVSGNDYHSMMKMIMENGSRMKLWLPNGGKYMPPISAMGFSKISPLPSDISEQMFTDFYKGQMALISGDEASECTNLIIAHVINLSATNDPFHLNGGDAHSDKKILCITDTVSAARYQIAINAMKLDRVSLFPYSDYDQLLVEDGHGGYLINPIVYRIGDFGKFDLVTIDVPLFGNQARGNSVSALLDMRSLGHTMMVGVTSMNSKEHSMIEACADYIFSYKHKPHIYRETLISIRGAMTDINRRCG